jgi:hypothetical protein
MDAGAVRVNRIHVGPQAIGSQLEDLGMEQVYYFRYLSSDP